jgi:predicted PurR-regulated permease PerM
VAILLGTEIAGILGALIAIPVAGSIQVVIGEMIQDGTSVGGRS